MNKKSFFLYSIVLLFPFLTSAKVCEKTNFNYTFNKKKIRQPISACYSNGQLVSESCYNIQCKLKKKISQAKLKINFVGSPHFHICHQVGGRPIVGKIDNKWGAKKLKTFSLCFDNKKQDFVDADYLLRQRLEVK